MKVYLSLLLAATLLRASSKAQNVNGTFSFALPKLSLPAASTYRSPTAYTYSSLPALPRLTYNASISQLRPSIPSAPFFISPQSFRSSFNTNVSTPSPQPFGVIFNGAALTTPSSRFAYTATPPPSSQTPQRFIYTAKSTPPPPPPRIQYTATPSKPPPPSLSPPLISLQTAYVQNLPTPSAPRIPSAPFFLPRSSFESNFDQSDSSSLPTTTPPPSFENNFIQYDSPSLPTTPPPSFQNNFGQFDSSSSPSFPSPQPPVLLPNPSPLPSSPKITYLNNLPPTILEVGPPLKVFYTIPIPVSNINNNTQNIEKTPENPISYGLVATLDLDSFLLNYQNP